MANLAQMVNAIAPIVTTPETAVRPAHLLPVPAARPGSTGGRRRRARRRPHGQPAAPAHPSRWPHRVADLGPFSLVDAAATTSSDRRRLALTLVNRSPDQPEKAEIVLRNLAFDGVAEVRSLTAEHGPDARTLPDVESACLEQGSEKPSGQALTLTLPPRSFTVVEAATANP